MKKLRALTTVVGIASLFTLFSCTEQPQEISFEDTVIATGITLVENNSIALIVPAVDNAFTSINKIVTTTVDRDYIEYGVYMDSGRRPWVYATRENPEGMPNGFEPLSDSISLWAANRTKASYKVIERNGEKVIEFVAPVYYDNGESLSGHIRYGINVETLKKVRYTNNEK